MRHGEASLGLEIRLTIWSLITLNSPDASTTDHVTCVATPTA